MDFIDHFLDRVTMYRLVLYYLVVLLGITVVGSVLGFITYSPLSIIGSTIFLTAVCYCTNKVFSYVYKAPTNVESVYITALILACIVIPLKTYHDLPMLFWISVWAMGSKYMFAIGKKHVFNPVAIAAVVVTYGLNQAPSWWIGNAFMAPFVFVGGLLVVRKIQRGSLVLSFFAATMFISLGASILFGTSIVTIVSNLILRSSLLFFLFVMLTEPLTIPPTKYLQILYGGITGILFSPQLHIGSLYFTPELALVLGNMFSYMVSPKEKLLLFVKEKLPIAQDAVDFVFALPKKLPFAPGQYMEWTLAHKGVDSRGNRRYFTLASSPTEEEIRIGVKFYGKGSSYKKAMLLLSDKSPVVASQITGDFTLPQDTNQKLVFVAGGIGITPFRSMIKYLLDTNQERSIILLYSNKTKDEIVYTDVFSEAQKVLGIKTVYTLTDEQTIPAGWQGRVGRIDAAMIQQEIPDFMERLFYLSGPHVMVSGFEKTLVTMGIPSSHIKKDFFPGFA